MAQEITLDRLAAAIGDALVICDRDGRIVRWNAAAERMFGFSQNEALGQSMDIFIPERLRQRHWEGCNQTMRTGITKYGTDVLRVPAIDKLGRSLSIAFTVALFAGEDGKPAAIAALIRDETARFAEERALRKRVAELEVQLATRESKPQT